MKDKILIILSIILIIISLSVGVYVRNSEEGILFDMDIMKYIHGNMTLEIAKFMNIITFFGSSYFFIFIGIIIFIFLKRNNNCKGIILLITSTLGSYILNYILKNIFVRTRPLEYFLIEQGGYSFPSGHSMVSISFYTTMTYLLTKSQSSKRINIILWIANFIIVAFIGFSRVFLGVHWPTDVLVGFILGLVYSYATVKIVEKTNN
ncbi:phosphatase PAP2 family protein [Schnuerera sp. xch1]|uniref:phosphatase PAP2 family protein n=1 Tax=Schnuerera sp. xch1 TaxID=2874283 RepID=UPI001CBD2035|nr:phosphatase PAP2 family protein [Schnuerera sp. xch1]MBZ2175276.1 phosphatase PAP2 family protein [Schnuerera sp. xch1]